MNRYNQKNRQNGQNPGSRREIPRVFLEYLDIAFDIKDFQHAVSDAGENHGITAEQC